MGVVASHGEGSGPTDEPTPLRPSQAAGTPATTGGGPKGASSADLEQAINLLRARIDEEFRISERLDAKGRQAFALAAGFFAVVQTIAFGSFAEQSVKPSERVLLGIVAVIGGLAVWLTAHRLTDGEDLHDEDDVKPSSLVRWCNDADEAAYVSVRIVSRLATVADNRTANNETRGHTYDRVLQGTRASLILAGVELTLAILVRI